MTTELNTNEMEVIKNLINRLAPSDRIQLGTWFRENCGVDIDAGGLAGGVYASIKYTLKGIKTTKQNKEFLGIIKKFLRLGEDECVKIIRVQVEKFV
jgi:hypothetical protein